MPDQDDKAINDAERWLNDHERPSFDYLMKLAQHHTPQAAEILQNYAEEYEVPFDPDMSLEETVQKIWQAMERNPDATYK